MPVNPARIVTIPRLWRLSLDPIGLTEAIGGFIHGLIALFSSYDHITFAGTTIGLQRQ